MARLNLSDKWVVVTGASSGLGRALAFHLATEEKSNVIIAARRKDKLEELKKEIESIQPSRVEIVEVDLSEPEGADFLFNRAVEIAEIYGLINNAGVTFYGNTEESQYNIYKEIIDVNLIAVMKLSLRFLSYFTERGGGAILNVSSMGAFFPMPYQNVYSASKHAIQVFTEGLYQECRKGGVVISSFAPGGIATEMLTKSGLDKKYDLNSVFNMKAEVVAKKAVRSLKKKKFLSVPGFFNNLVLFLIRLFPRKVVARVLELVYRLPEKK